MTERMIDISSSARLSVNLGRLVLQQQDQETVAVPLDEIAAVVVSHPNVLFTHAVLSRLAQANAVFVACDEKHLPVGMLLPLQSHYAQREVFALQAALKLPTRKRLWQQVVGSKIRAQAALLEHVTGSTHGLGLMIQEIRSGDPTNVEGRAARRYWSSLFGRRFRRDPDAGDLNSLLNYGYAILRAIVVRAICAAGLHPSVSLHHHNRYDCFALADDLMEPFRPVVDHVVWTRTKSRQRQGDLSKEDKRHLLAIAAVAYPYRNNESRSLFDITSRLACSLVRVIRGRAKTLDIPTHWEFNRCQS